MSARVYKYVVLRHALLPDLTVPVRFPECLQHSDMVNGPHKPVSAGFCKVENGKHQTYDRSVSLDLAPGPDDAKLLDMFCS